MHHRRGEERRSQHELGSNTYIGKMPAVDRRMIRGEQKKEERRAQHELGSNTHIGKMPAVDRRTMACDSLGSSARKTESAPSTQRSSCEERRQQLGLVSELFVSSQGLHARGEELMGVSL